MIPAVPSKHLALTVRRRRRVLFYDYGNDYIPASRNTPQLFFFRCAKTAPNTRAVIFRVVTGITRHSCIFITVGYLQRKGIPGQSGTVCLQLVHVTVGLKPVL